MVRNERYSQNQWKKCQVCTGLFTNSDSSFPALCRNSTAFYKDKQWNEVENCQSQGKEQKHGRGTSGRAKSPSQAHTSPNSSGVPPEMNRSKFSLRVKCHHLACPASREILAVSAREAESLQNGTGMQAAVAHMVGTGTQNPGE